MTPIGKRDARIILQRSVSYVDSQGSVLEVWSTLATVWAGIGSLTSKETVNGNERAGATETAFSIRYQAALVTLNPRDRLIWGTAVYDIASALPIPQSRPAEIIITGTLKTDIAAIGDTGGDITHNGSGLTHDGVDLEHGAESEATTVSHDGEELTHDGEVLTP